MTPQTLAIGACLKEVFRGSKLMEHVTYQAWAVCVEMVVEGEGLGALPEMRKM